ncbi:MAG: YeaH/YhbH family protein [Rhodocyclaceae bacterium]|nr:YeaH/YhbH family protein [Rhodocyclaceae bacterium]
MVMVIDRRFDSKKKSAVNRQRFLRRYKEQLRKAVSDAIADRSIRDMQSGESVSIPSRDISEPHFHHDRSGGERETVHPGNDQFQSGDLVNRPLGGGGGGGGGSGASEDGEGEDSFAFTLSREEFLNIFFDDLALPDLVKTQLARITEYKRVRAGYTASGIPANLNVVRSLRGATGRRMALQMPYRRQLKEAEDKLAELLASLGDAAESSEEVLALREEIRALEARIQGVPFIDTFDLRFNNRIRLPQPTTQAVMFCLMDVSGSMDEERKAMAKRFFMLLYLFLTRTYERIEVVFIRHHTTAKEVDENDFFHSRESGGTVVSSALLLMRDVLRERYADGLWNIYGAQASDGDNWENDSPRCGDLLRGEILPWVQYFAYIEITRGEPQNLWREYERLAGGHPNFAMQRIEELTDIYPVFRELFKKKLA